MHLTFFRAITLLCRQAVKPVIFLPDFKCLLWSCWPVTILSHKWDACSNYLLFCKSCDPILPLILLNTVIKFRYTYNKTCQTWGSFQSANCKHFMKCQKWVDGSEIKYRVSATIGSATGDSHESSWTFMTNHSPSLTQAISMLIIQIVVEIPLQLIC